MAKITYTEELARSIQNYGEQDPCIYNAEMKRWRKKWNAEYTALKKLEAMPEAEFQTFLKSLPQRVQLLVRGGMVEWKKVLPEWYIKIYG